MNLTRLLHACSAFIALPSLAWAIACGDILVGGMHALTADLDCSAYADTDAAVTLRDGATLDLGGFRLTAQIVGVRLEGSGASVVNGEVAGVWILVEALGTGHAVRDLDVIGDPDYAVYVIGDGNTVERVDFGAGAYHALIVEGSDNLIGENYVDSVDIAYWVIGDRNEIRFNIIRRSLLGLRVDGDQNAVSRNNLGLDAVEQGYLGLEVSGAGNTFVSNFVRHYDLDLSDAAGECVTNTYLNNDIQTADPPCAVSSAFRSAFRR